MGIATPPVLPPILSLSTKPQHSFSSILDSNSMSQDYHQGIFTFSNGYERSTLTQHQQQQQQHQQQQLAQQIRRDKVRVQGGLDPPPPLVGIEEEESVNLPVYETGGMLSEMFNFPPPGASATELLEQQHQPATAMYRTSRSQPLATDWYRQGMLSGLGDSKNQNSRDNSGMLEHHHPHPQISSMNAHSAAAMQLFLMNPQTRSPSPTQNHTPNSSSLQGFSAQGGSFGQFTWAPHSSQQGAAAATANPPQIGGVMEAQGLSLSLSSSLQHLEAAKAEELRMGDSGFLYYNQGGSGGSSSAQYPYKTLHFQGPVGVAQNHQGHVGFGSSLGVVNVLRNSKYVKAAQELLEEFCSVGRGQFKRNKFTRQNSNPSSNPGGGGGGSSSSLKDPPPLSSADRIEHQRRKVKLLSMLDEVDRRYNHYCEQMQMVVNSFDMVMGFGSAVPYTALAQKAMSRHFRCLKDAITAQLRHSCELLGEKDGAGSSGLTKGETPRLKLLEQSLRQQRAFHQIGMMEQEAWRPQRGLPERSVNILRAWLFEHFLHPYPSDADKHLLARQTGLSRNQVSNWFINARVRLWKPMIEEMYQQELKEVEGEERGEKNQSNSNSNVAQTPTTAATTSTATAPPPSTTTTTTTTLTTAATAAGKRSQIKASDSDHSLIAINTQPFSETQPNHSASAITTTPTAAVAATSEVAPPASQCYDSDLPPHRSMVADDTCRHGSLIAADYGTASGNSDIASTLIRFGTTAGDVSLTLGLRHAGNIPEKAPPFSVRDFGGI
ncbi:BEL1-like homeodomain protein 4 [Prosopis cineraria]|uniref:BEL1-like homeodomain protein 4 n=1 Tax=Prosopis cineraria TaxID=364024 RepID=UPI00240EFA8D|nr:BEL1-like homeodomain protein 4 [Prosopis cineraria]